ncbi:MAG: hypothetical protein FJY77_05860, partial [Candidatus Altiarchaeales archaeon]|nr:hypothetical protein [Candidatus Altiarchaeales archaeon]
MKKACIALAFTAVFALGCLCGQTEPAGHSISNISDDVREYRSEAHGGYSFRFKTPLVFDENSSAEDVLMTSLVFIDNLNESVMVVGVIPKLLANTEWMKSACNRETLVQQLRAQEDLNVTDVKSIVNKEFKNVKCCTADATAVEEGVEIPLKISFGECKGELPFYAMAGGLNST